MCIRDSIYRYNVTAVSGDRMSLPTNNAELYDLVTPVLDPVESVEAVSYTHLDVYKRQNRDCPHAKSCHFILWFQSFVLTLQS